MTRYYPFLLLLLALPVQGFELFGVNLSTATRDEFRQAVKRSGAKLLSEAGKDTFYDVYQGSSLLQNAGKLYLGFTKTSQQLAFVEYEFNGLQQPALLKKLIQKYGQPAKKPATFLSDFTFQWQKDGVVMSFYQDWAAYKTRLSYIRPGALEQLKQEKIQYEQTRQDQQVRYQEAAY